MSIGIGAGVCIPLGFLTAVTSVLKTTTVPSRRGLSDVTLGYPFRWLSQDQTFFLPPRFPSQTSFTSPWLSPTQLRLSGLAADTMFWAVALWLALMLVLTAALLIRSGIRGIRGNLAGPAVSTLG
jgi:hypothetical protein